MYRSIRLPWSQLPSKAEEAYRLAGFVRTQGTIFLLPPDQSVLIESFNAPPRSKTRMSSGAVALCKHFERGEASSEHGMAHLFWPLPKGSNENKSEMAAEVLDGMLKDAQWKNVMMLHKSVAVYEIRNSLGYGMRWTLELDETPNTKTSETGKDDEVASEQDDTMKQWTIRRILFRGFLEPIVGLDHELLQLVPGSSSPC